MWYDLGGEKKSTYISIVVPKVIIIIIIILCPIMNHCYYIIKFVVVQYQTSTWMGKKKKKYFYLFIFFKNFLPAFDFQKKNCSFLFHFLSFLLQLLFFKDWMTTSKWSIFATASSNSNKLKKLKFSFFLLYNVCQCVPNIILIDYNACWVLSFIYDVYLQNYSLPLVTSRHANDDDDKEILTLFLFFLISLSIIFCLIFIIAFACF